MSRILIDCSVEVDASVPTGGTVGISFVAVFFFVDDGLRLIRRNPVCHRMIYVFHRGAGFEGLLLTHWK